MAEKRREKRRRNLTQAVSLSSLGVELDEGKSSLHSPVLTSESDKLHSMEGRGARWTTSHSGDREILKSSNGLLPQKRDSSLMRASLDHLILSTWKLCGTP